MTNIPVRPTNKALSSFIAIFAASITSPSMNYETLPRLTDWLPTTRKEMEIRGCDSLDVIIVSGDAYVGHPSIYNKV